MRIISNVQDINSYTQENHFTQGAVTVTTAHGRIFLSVSSLRKVIDDYDKAAKGRTRQPVRDWLPPSIAATATPNYLDVGATEEQPEEPKEKKIEQVDD